MGHQDMWKWIWSLTHWGRVTLICVSKLTTIGSDNGLSPARRRAIIWTNDGILLIRTLGKDFSEILSEIHSFSLKKMHLKMSSAKWRLFRLGLNELNSYSVQMLFINSNACCWSMMLMCFLNPEISSHIIVMILHSLGMTTPYNLGRKRKLKQKRVGYIG